MASTEQETPSVSAATAEQYTDQDAQESVVVDEEVEKQNLTAAQELDAQIAAARDEIAALQHRRSTLSAFLLSNPPSSIQSLLTSVPSTPSPTTTKLLSAHSAQQASTLRSLYRLCTGATTFETRDPSPSAVDGGYILGIRIEVFSSETGVFLAPYYALLNRPWRVDGNDGGTSGAYYKLHRHTFPPWVPVKEICARWLPAPLSMDVDVDVEVNDSGDGAVEKQDLASLARELRSHIVSYHRREDAVRKMASDNAAYVSRVVLPDAENLEAKVSLKNGCMAGIRLDAKGRIRRVNARDELGRRMYRLERRVMKAGRVERIDFKDVDGER